MLEKLRDSVLSPRHAATLKLQPCTEQMAADLGVNPPWAGFKIPYFTPDGAVVKDFYRYRFWPVSAPSTGWASLKEPSKLRYVQPKDSELHVYMPPILKGVTWRDVMETPEVEIDVTEGELKSACVCANGRIMLGLGGVHSWMSRRHKQELLPILKEFSWKGRRVNLAFDSDKSSNPLVQLALSRLAVTLTREGALVHDVALSPGPGGSKRGVDDFVAAEGFKAYEDLVESSAPIASSLELHRLNDEVALVWGGGAAGNIVRYEDAHILTPVQFTRSVYRDRTYMEFGLKADGTPASPKLKHAAEEWMAWGARARVGGVTYAPGRGRIADGAFNIWRDTGCEPRKGDTGPWEELLARLFPAGAIDPEHLLWFKRWLAYPVRYPGTKLFSCVLLWSHKGGTGKNLLAEAMVPIYGGSNCTLIDSDQLTGGFNGWAEAKQFIIGDEITLDDKRHTSGRLKSIITSRRIRINRKGIEAYEIPDCANYILTSNDPASVTLEQGERRTFAYHMPEKALGDAYGARFMRWVYGYAGPPYDKPAVPGSGAAALAWHLTRELDLGDFSPTAEPPDTDAKLELIANSRSDIDTWAVALRTDPSSILGGVGAKYSGNGHGPYTVYTPADLLKLYDPEERKRASLRAMGIAMDRAGFKKALYNNGRLGNVRSTFWLVGTDKQLTSQQAAKIYTEERPERFTPPSARKDEEPGAKKRRVQ